MIPIEAWLWGKAKEHKVILPYSEVDTLTTSYADNRSIIVWSDAYASPYGQKAWLDIKIAPIFERYANMPEAVQMAVKARELEECTAKLNLLYDLFCETYQRLQIMERDRHERT